MARTIDILDERERLTGSVFYSIFLHISVIVFVVGYGLYAKRFQQPFGEPNAGAGMAVAVTPVNSIPIPPRQGPENPVANDSESVIPTAPQAQETVQKQLEAAIQIPDETKTPKQSQQERRKKTYVAPTEPNQILGRSPQAAVNPMYEMKAGSNGVGLGPNSPLGQRFGWYAEMVRRRIAQNWATSGLAGTQGSPAMIGFVILRDGSIRDVRLEQSSGNAAIDNSALRAVYASNPLPPLPLQYVESTAPAEFTFNVR
jgi:TonB family protein